MSVLLDVKDLRAGYGDVRVLHGLSFSIAQGGVTTLLGANGAGKTTTLRALSRMIRASGEVTFAGRRIDGLSAEEIDSYLESGEWRGKACGYAIQGRAEALVRMLSGSYSGVMGLPLYETRALLRAAGYPLG